MREEEKKVHIAGLEVRSNNNNIRILDSLWKYATDATAADDCQCRFC